jgi:hypothetical protein
MHRCDGLFAIVLPGAASPALVPSLVMAFLPHGISSAIHCSTWVQAPVRINRVDTESKFGVACFFRSAVRAVWRGASSNTPSSSRIVTGQVGPTAVFTAGSGSGAFYCFNVEVENPTDCRHTSRNLPRRDVELYFSVGFSNQRYSSENDQTHHPNI